MAKYDDFQNAHRMVAVCGSAAEAKSSATMDTKGMEQAVVILRTGLMADTGTLDVKVQHAVLGDGSDWVDLPGAVFTQKLTANDDTTYVGKIKCNTSGVNRYLKIVGTAAAAATNYAAILIGLNVSGHYPLVTNPMPTPEFDVFNVS